MFRDVPGCSGMFHVPGFVNAQLKGMVYTKKNVQMQQGTLKTKESYTYLITSKLG